MGATTLYHPVSLTVIRGSAEYHGFRFGRLRQLYSEPEKCQARYEVNLERVPGELAGLSLMELQNVLQDCFMDDVRVHWLHYTKMGKLACQLAVSGSNWQVVNIE